MINILARRLKEAKKAEGRTGEARMQDAESTAMELGHMSNEELYEQDFEDGEYDSLSSTIKSDLQASDEGEGEQWTSKLTDKVPYKYDCYYHYNFSLQFMITILSTRRCSSSFLSFPPLLYCLFSYSSPVTSLNFLMIFSFLLDFIGVIASWWSFPYIL